MKSTIALSITAIMFLLCFSAISVWARPIIQIDRVGDDPIEFSYVVFPDGRIFLQYIGPHPRDLAEDPYPYIPTETPKKLNVILRPPSLEQEDTGHSSETPPPRFGRR